MFSIDMVEINDFEQKIKQSVFYSIDNRYLFGLNFKFTKEEVIALLNHQKQLHETRYPKPLKNIYDSLDENTDLSDRNTAIQVHNISCENLDETTTGIYYKQSYQYIDSLIYCTIDANTQTLNAFEISIASNGYNHYWQQNSIIKIIIDVLTYEYGYFTIEYRGKVCCFIWTTEDEIVTLMIRHPDDIEKYYYSYKITFEENWD